MNRSRLFAWVLMLAVCAGVLTPGAAFAADDVWGMKVEIAGVTYTELPRQFDPNEKAVMLNNGSLSMVDLLWSPDGKNIVYTDRASGVWTIPATGGTPRLLFDGIFEYPYKDKVFYFREPISAPGCFSADGKYLYLSYGKYDESRGAVITITENGSGGFSVSANPSPACRTLVRIDTTTLKVEEIGLGTVLLAASDSGRYFCCRDEISLRTFVRDMISGETWDIPATAASVCFNHAEDMLIYMGISDYQLYRVPFRGGAPEQLSSYPGGDMGEWRQPFDCSFDDTWILYKDCTIQSVVSNSISHGNGTYSYSKPAERLCGFNMKTRQSVLLLPYVPSYSFIDAMFSPDGKTFVYSRADNDIYESYLRTAAFVKTFDPLGASGSQTAVSDARPAGFAITANYPNPFNPSTTITFSLAAAVDAKLAVYDITGRKVRELVNGRLAPGVHTAVWNGRDDSGVPVASGTYISRLRAGGAETAHRMLLVK